MKNFSFCQSDSNAGAGYDTYNFSRDRRFGFVCINKEFDFVAHISFDSSNEFAQLLGCENVYEPLEAINVGESLTICDGEYIRIW